MGVGGGAVVGGGGMVAIVGTGRILAISYCMFNGVVILFFLILEETKGFELKSKQAESL